MAVLNFFLFCRKTESTGRTATVATTRATRLQTASGEKIQQIIQENIGKIVNCKMSRNICFPLPFSYCLANLSHTQYPPTLTLHETLYICKMGIVIYPKDRFTLLSIFLLLCLCQTRMYKYTII